MKILSPIYKLTLAALISFALYKEIYVNGVIRSGVFAYFTIQSNLLAVICLLLFLFLPQKNRGKCLMRGISLLAITLTGFVYNFVMYKIYNDWGTAGYSLTRTITHVVAPLGFILDWLLFDKHGMVKTKDILIWLIYPAIYSAASVYAGFRYGFSIYFFLNTANGYVPLLRWMGIILGGLLAVGFLYIGLDKTLGKMQKRRA